jgi:magnesium chelatase family protein
MHLEVPAVAFKELSGGTAGTSSANMREAVQVARERQQQRFKGTTSRTNAHMNSRLLRTHCTLDDAGQQLLKESMTELGLSARAHDKVLRVARTIADLEGQDRIQVGHLNEAINYRLLDRKM